jgi:glutaconyl-CoA/methylmalonyl-CoA decarboxylase subunit gamma
MNGQVLFGRRVKVIVNGKPYMVEVLGSLTSSPVTVNVNGQPYVVDIGTADVTTKPTESPSSALDKVVRETSAPQKAPKPDSPAGPSVPNMKVPMPGTIIEVLVNPGDRVKYGQQLFTLEAMKMKNALRSPRDGEVATIEIAVGQTVSHGQVLLTFKGEEA